MQPLPLDKPGLAEGWEAWQETGSLGDETLIKSLNTTNPIILTSSLTHVDASVKAAEGVVDAVHVRLSNTPAVRHSTCDIRELLIGQLLLWSLLIG